MSEPAIGPDASVRLCTLQSRSLGDAATDDMSELLAGPGVQQFRGAIPDFCDGCPYRKSCLGGCGAAAEWVLGSAAALDPFIAQHVMPDFWERVAQQQAKRDGDATTTVVDDENPGQRRVAGPRAGGSHE